MRWLLLIVVLFTAGCGIVEKSLEDRAAAYYNYVAGRSPQTDFSSFNTPAYKNQLKQAGSLADYDEALRGKQISERYPEITPEDIHISRQEGFAITVADPGLGPLLANHEPVRWVKVGRSWFVYIGADSEIGYYGVFPTTLVPPKIEDAEDGSVEEAGSEGAAEESPDSEGQPDMSQ